MIDNDVTDKLKAMTALGENWDSYGASKPSIEALDRAIALLRAMAAHKPQVVPTVHGRIEIEFGEDVSIVVGRHGDDDEVHTGITP